MRKIAVLNQKGGVGKTTTVANVAAALAAQGQRVVVIDMDPQAHLTIHLGVEPESIESGCYRVLTQHSTFAEEIMMVRPNLWLLPANIHLVGAESELVSVVGREIILREAIESVEDQFDYLIIDCAPSLGLLTLNSLAATDEVLIPLQPHFLALQGLGKLLQTVDLVNKRINPELRVKWVLMCMYDSRASLPNEVRADIREFLDNARGTNCAWSDAEILPVHVRRNIKLAEAPSYGKTIFEYEPSCHGAEDYTRIARVIAGLSLEEPESKSEPVQTVQETTETMETQQAQSEAPQEIAEAVEIQQVEEPSPAAKPVEAQDHQPPQESQPATPPIVIREWNNPKNDNAKQAQNIEIASSEALSIYPSDDEVIKKDTDA